MIDAPMRPTNIPKRLPDIRDYWVEIKYDGWYVVFRNRRAYTRHGEDITGWACFKGMDLPENAVGELLHRDGRHLIPRLKNSPDGLDVVLFDSPSDEPYEERKRQTQYVAGQHGFGYAHQYQIDSWETANAFLAERQAMGDEGLVLKRRNSPWESGDSKHWYRMKKPVKV